MVDSNSPNNSSINVLISLVKPGEQRTSELSLDIIEGKDGSVSGSGGNGKGKNISKAVESSGEKGKGFALSQPLKEDGKSCQKFSPSAQDALDLQADG